MRLKEKVKLLLADQCTQPKSSLSQNFLIDETLLVRIAAECRPSDTDCIVEIGAGTGTLTRTLAERAGKVWALEIDEELVPILKQQTGFCENVQTLEADALHFDFATFCRQHGCTKAVGNLPYHLATAIVLRLVAQQWWQTMLFTVQRELAERFLARPGSKQRGALTVVLGYHACLEHVIHLPPQAFYPMPRVTSSVVRFCRRRGPCVRDYALFRALVRAAFSLRRKTMVNSLSRGMSLPRAKVQRILRASGVPWEARAEALEVGDFIRLAAAARDEGVSCAHTGPRAS